MTSLKHLKTRIRGAKSTQKITKAMKMVSISKMNRARTNLDISSQSLKHVDNMSNSLYHLISSYGHTNQYHLVSQDMLQESELDLEIRDEIAEIQKNRQKNKKTTLLIVIGGNRGLSGAFNQHIYNETMKEYRNLQSQNRNVDFAFIGQKAFSIFKNIIPEQNVIYKTNLLTEKDEYSEFVKILQAISSISTNYDEVKLCYSEFESILKQTARIQRMFPILSSQDKRQEDAENSINHAFDGNPQDILSEFIDRYIEYTLYNRILNVIAGDHAARITSMDSATNNATSMIKDLTLQYNKTRQDKITTELIEIIAGSETV